MSDGYIVGLTAAEAANIASLYRDYLRLRDKIPNAAEMSNAQLNDVIDPIIGKCLYFVEVVRCGITPWASYIHATPASQARVGIDGHNDVGRDDDGDH